TPSAPRGSPSWPSSGWRRRSPTRSTTRPASASATCPSRRRSSCEAQSQGFRSFSLRLRLLPHPGGTAPPREQVEHPAAAHVPLEFGLLVSLTFAVTGLYLRRLGAEAAREVPG